MGQTEVDAAGFSPAGQIGIDSINAINDYKLPDADADLSTFIFSLGHLFWEHSYLFSVQEIYYLLTSNVFLTIQ